MPAHEFLQFTNYHYIQSEADINHRLWISQEPNDRMLGRQTDEFEWNALLYHAILWRTIDGASGETAIFSQHTEQFSHAVPYPYDKLRAGADTQNSGALPNILITIRYTIETINLKQLTAISIRRGTVRHARAQGPEP